MDLVVATLKSPKRGRDPFIPPRGMMGMFTGQPHFDDSPLWQRMDRGSFLWRISFVEMGMLVNGINTREVLEPLHPGAPQHWFNGYIQSSHSLQASHFEALRTVFEKALRLERFVA